MWNCTRQSCQLRTMHAVFADPHLDVNYSHQWRIESCRRFTPDMYRQTALVISSEEREKPLLEACNSLCGIKCYYIFQPYIFNPRTSPSPFHMRSLTVVFTPHRVLCFIMRLEHPTSSSSKSGNQHHGELLSRKE